MNVTCKMENPADPNRGIYIATREDGQQFEVARYPSGWRVNSCPQTFKTKRAAIEFVAGL